MEYLYTKIISNVVNLCNEIFTQFNKKVIASVVNEEVDGYVNYIHKTEKNNLQIVFNKELSDSEKSILDNIIKAL